jgi:tRNA G18 (ribose-2'-O)-methylase SpoU
VPHTVSIANADDPRLADYTRLTDVGLRTHLEAEHGLFMAEGTKVITRAVAAGYAVRSVLLAQSRLADLPALGIDNSKGSVPAYVVPDDVAERLTGYRVHRGALASFNRKPLPAVTDVIKDADRIVVLEDLVDHGNVGAIFRCAAALGVDAMLISPRCADPLYRRSVKVSMGAVFAIPYARMTEWFDGLAELKNSGFTVLALTPDERATLIGKALAKSGPRVALLLGTEGDGLSARWLREADDAVRIPMRPAARSAGVDSLNVVAAAAIACHLLAGADGGGESAAYVRTQLRERPPLRATHVELGTDYSERKVAPPASVTRRPCLVNHPPPSRAALRCSDSTSAATCRQSSGVSSSMLAISSSGSWPSWSWCPAGIPS